MFERSPSENTAPTKISADAYETLNTFHAKQGKLLSILTNLKIGVVPLPAYIVLVLLIGFFSATGRVPSDLTMSIAILATGGFFFMEVARRAPLLGRTGGATILAFVIPSASAYAGLIPVGVLASVNDFMKASNFLYLYIAVIIVGSILCMDRHTLISGCLKIFLPLFSGSVVATIVGTLAGIATGQSASHSFFFVVVPIMAGGVGEGAIPLSAGYSWALGQSHEQIFAQLLPIVMLGSFMAVLLCGLLNLLGKKFPHLTGEGQLLRDENHIVMQQSKPYETVSPAAIGGAGVTIVAYYLIGVMLQRLCDFPAPITMLFLVAAAKTANLVSPTLESASRTLYVFFSSIVTWPLLFAMGIALTPWEPFVRALNISNVVTVFATVASLIGAGFATARFVDAHPIDIAIVNGCHSGQGGTGDIAILTAANRMQLMPFAQIASRIGGAITVTLALIMFRYGAKWYF
ncbi:2-hydroxycarboxylate transporter family protein [Ochrobactrum sp. GPK 3]|uniref:2-hydroxycarboxylate transporter family protein n=1 Tax=Brucella sp. 22210 TaxID=3453892 RepID=UPI0031385150